ncbi:MAG: substrate-binding domain-containing protein, partial [Eubacteriales bacterium]|nr:substrate-binding domain-containing protein [Eubacteriales bacterium]
NGVEPSVEATVSGDYTLARPFAYTTRASGDYESDEKEQIVEALVAFLTQSTEGLEAVFDAGGIVEVSSGTPWEELKDDYAIVDQDNSHLEITTGGSTSVEKAVLAALESFQVHAGNVQFTMDQTGSGDGWARVLGDEKDGPNGKDIGFASRNFKDKEPTEDALASGVFCQDAIVVVVHAANSYVDDVSKDDLYAIFTNATTDWAEVAK